MEKRMYKAVEKKIDQQKIIEDEQLQEYKKNPATDKISLPKKDLLARRLLSKG